MSDCSVWQDLGTALLVPVAVVLGFVLAFVTVAILVKLADVLSKLWPVVLVALLVPALAHAASIKVCVTAPTSPDAAALRVYAGATPLTPDFTGTFTTPTTCASYAPPATRGTSLDYTAHFVNAFGEEGPASNAITFRAPAVPPAPALLSVGGSATP